MVDDFETRDNHGNGDADAEGCEGGHIIRIGIITFGQQLNFYWVRPKSSDPIGMEHCFLFSVLLICRVDSMCVCRSVRGASG